MKKLIGLLTILMLTTTVFGQTRGADLGEFFPFKYFEYSLTYRFTENNKEYAIAYEAIPRTSMGTAKTSLLNSNDIIERNLYLYRNDGDKWTIVSNIIKTDYWKVVDGVQSYDYYVENPANTNSDINKLIGDIGGYSSIEPKKGFLAIRMLNFYGVVGVDAPYNYRWTNIRLFRKDDGTFTTVYTPSIIMKP